MDGLNFLPKKYNNPVVIGLGVALAVAIAYIAYMHYQQLKPRPVPAKQQSAQRPMPQALPLASQGDNATETFVGEDSGKPTLVLLWGSWCPHSVNMMPAWENVKKTLNESGTFEAKDFETSRDAQIVKDLSQKLPGFGGFPDIRIYPQGFGMDSPNVQYKGPRTEEGILKFVYQQGS